MLNEENSVRGPVGFSTRRNSTRAAVGLACGSSEDPALPGSPVADGLGSALGPRFVGPSPLGCPDAHTHDEDAVVCGVRQEARCTSDPIVPLLHRQAIEINDSLLQRMTAAKWALESGRTEAGLEILTTAVSEAHRLVSELLRRAEMGGHSELLSAPETTSASGVPEAAAD